MSFLGINLVEDFLGDFENLKEPYIDDYVLSYMGLDKDKVEKKYKTVFDFVNSFLQSKVFHVDLDLYGKNAQPFHGVIDGINKLVDSGLELRVLTARDPAIDTFVDDKEKDGIIEKTYRFVKEQFPNVNELVVVGHTKQKKPYIKKTDIWIDDRYESLLPDLNTNDIYIVKHTFPCNEHLFAHSEITDGFSKNQPFVENVLNYAKKTNAKRITTDLDDTAVTFKSRLKETCDYALKMYSSTILKDLFTSK